MTRHREAHLREVPNRVAGRSGDDARVRPRALPILASAISLGLALGGSGHSQTATATAWFDTLPIGDPVRTVDGGPVSRKLKLDGTTRNALLADHSGPPLSLAATDATSLDLAVAVVCPPPAKACAGSTRFTLEAVSPRTNQPQTLVSVTLGGDGTSQRWHESTVDLRQLEKAVRLRLTTEVVAGNGTPSGQQHLAVWGEPLLRGVAARDGLNVILISIDTLRADRLGSYGHHRDTSPELDRLAAEGARFSQVVSQSPWTTPAHMSMLTSLHPSSHKVNDSWRFVMQSGTRGQRRLAPETMPLADILRRQGFATAAITDGAPTMTAEIGFDRGFDHYREVVARPFSDYRREVSEQLAQLSRDRFFLFLHTFEVHAPYTHLRFVKPLLSEKQFADLSAVVAPGLRGLGEGRRLRAHLLEAGLFKKELTSALYDGGIRFVDESLIGTLVAELKRLDLYDSTIIVVTSDHGDEFGEHRKGRIYDAHCNNLWDSLLLVPLIVRAPGRIAPGVEVAEQVRLIDVPPTVLDLLGAKIPSAMEGRSLLPLLEDAYISEPVPAISEATCKGPEWKSIRSDGAKFITASTADTGAWWEVDLGESVDIDHIRIWTRDEPCCNPLEYYWVLVADQPHPLPNDRRTIRHFQTTLDGRPTVVRVGAAGRYVRILKFGDGHVTLAEVEVIRADTGENASLGRSATQSSTLGEADAARALDGGRERRFSARSMSHTENEIIPDLPDRTGMRGDFGIEMLFDVVVDPTEQRDVLRQRPDVGAQLRAELRRRMSEFAATASGTSDRQPIDPAVMERLRALGYAD